VLRNYIDHAFSHFVFWQKATVAMSWMYVGTKDLIGQTYNVCMGISAGIKILPKTFFSARMFRSGVQEPKETVFYKFLYDFSFFSPVLGVKGF